MRAPDRYPQWQPVDAPPRPAAAPATPVVYPLDDQVREGVLGPDGKPLAEGQRRKYPIGFAKPEAP